MEQAWNSINGVPITSQASAHESIPGSISRPVRLAVTREREGRREGMLINFASNLHDTEKASERERERVYNMVIARSFSLAVYNFERDAGFNCSIERFVSISFITLSEYLWLMMLAWLFGKLDD